MRFCLYLSNKNSNFAEDFNIPIVEAIIRTYYQVAGHLFAVETTDLALFSQLANYEPFQVGTPTTVADGTTLCPATVFALRVVQDGLLDEASRSQYQAVFTDQSDADMPRIEVYQSNLQHVEVSLGWLMRISQWASSPICSDLQMDRRFTRGVLHVAEDCSDIHFCVDNALMLLYAFRTISMKTLEMHAAVVVKEGWGYLFLGHSGTGKSTHARQWLQAFSDAYLMNDDNPILRVMENGEVRVYGSPWSGKTPCYNNTYARVGAVVKLSQSPYNQLCTLSMPQAYAYILSSASGLKMDQEMAENMYESIKYIVTHVKCYHLDCLPNTDAAEVCFAGVANRDYGKE